MRRRGAADEQGADPAAQAGGGRVRGRRTSDHRPGHAGYRRRTEHHHPGRERRRQKRADAADARAARADFGQPQVERAGSPARAPQAGDGVPAADHAAPLGAGERPVRSGARRDPGRRAGSPGARRSRRGRIAAARPSAGARSLRRRAAAARAGARLGAASRSAVPRRADRQPRSRRDARDRNHHQGLRRLGNQDRDGDSQPGAGAPAGRRGGLPAGRTRGGARARRALLLEARHGGGGGVHQRGSAVGLKAALLSTFLCFSSMAEAQPRYITLASTTSTEQSGLFKHLLPIFEKKTGIQVRVVAVGTGQALDMGRRGDADVALVHDKTAEERFVAEGWYVDRRDVMYNDFVVVGPRYDPARAHGADTVVALKKISAQKAPFASRGDKSGTHAAELRLWQIAGVDPASGKGAWYRETGSGMGPTLNTASARNAYAPPDGGTWLSFRNPGNLTLRVDGDKRRCKREVRIV